VIFLGIGFGEGSGALCVACPAAISLEAHPVRKIPALFSLLAKDGPELQSAHDRVMALKCFDQSIGRRRRIGDRFQEGGSIGLQKLHALALDCARLCLTG
jgi:hypothetical protein